LSNEDWLSQGKVYFLLFHMYGKETEEERVEVKSPYFNALVIRIIV